MDLSSALSLLLLAAGASPVGQATTGLGQEAGGAASAPDPEPIVVTGQTDRSKLERYLGRYALNGTIVTVELTHDNGLTLYRTGERPGRAWRMLTENAFESNSPRVRVFFEGEGPKATRIRSQYLGQEVVGVRIADDGAPGSTAR